MLAITPRGYVPVFQDFSAAVSSPDYLGYEIIDDYIPKACAALCDNRDGCTAFNIYVSRDPSKVPGVKCPNPPSTAVYNCALYGSLITAPSATATGQVVGPPDANGQPFVVRVRGSNGYNKIGRRPTVSGIGLPIVFNMTSGIRIISSAPFPNATSIPIVAHPSSISSFSMASNITRLVSLVNTTSVNSASRIGNKPSKGITGSTRATSSAMTPASTRPTSVNYEPSPATRTSIMSIIAPPTSAGSLKHQVSSISRTRSTKSYPDPTIMSPSRTKVRQTMLFSTIPVSSFLAQFRVGYSSSLMVVRPASSAGAIQGGRATISPRPAFPTPKMTITIPRPTPTRDMQFSVTT